MLLASPAVFSQKKSLAGIVLDAKSQTPVGLASIRNVNSGASLLSKTDGRFVADISRGQILAFSANGFYTDTLTVTDSVWSLSMLQIQLQPLPGALPNVVITAKLSPYQLDSLARRREFLENVGESKIPVLSHANAPNTFGIGINLDRLGRTERNRRHARNLFEITEEEAYINYRWNKALVEKYTLFRGNELEAFMQACRPSYAWLRKHVSEEEMVYYINAQLKKYKKE